MRENGVDLYIVHPKVVAEMVSQITDDEELICAAYLHDTIEDVMIHKPNDVKALNELKNEIRFLGADVLKYVEALSHDENKESYEEYLKRVCKDRNLIIIKMCDLIYNVTDSPDDEKRYRKSLFVLFRSLINAPDAEHEIKD